MNDENKKELRALAVRTSELRTKLAGDMGEAVGLVDTTDPAIFQKALIIALVDTVRVAAMIGHGGGISNGGWRELCAEVWSEVEDVNRDAAENVN